MTPFHREMRALTDSARLSGLRSFDVVFFHDVPGDTVYRDEGLKDGVSLDVALAPFRDAGILVVGDAGAARGRLDRNRVARTGALLDNLRRRSPNVAWLNPMPRTRWPGSTAGEIASLEGVSMYPFDALGLIAAVDTLRGITTA